jgi:hypothetical protein
MTNYRILNISGDAEKAFLDFMRDEFGMSLSPGKPGRPNKWTSDRIMHIWLLVELERYKRKLNRGRHAFVGDEKEIWITPEIKRRRHSEGNKLMRKDAKLAQLWAERLEYAKVLIDRKARLRPKRKVRPDASAQK